MKDKVLLDQVVEVNEDEIKALVVAIAVAEEGIAAHQAEIAGLTPKLVFGLYRLGSLLMALPGAQGDLKQAKGMWLKRAVGLCGNKDKVYWARDVFNQFEDPHDHKVRGLGASGEERAQAFRGTIAALEKLIKDKKYYEADSRRLQRMREAEAQKPAHRREPTAANAGNAGVVQNATVRVVSPCEEVGEGAQEPEIADAETQPVVESARHAEIIDAEVQSVAEVEQEPATERREQTYQEYVACEFLQLCGEDVRVAVGFLVDHFWSRAEALSWLTGLMEEEKATKISPAYQPTKDDTEDDEGHAAPKRPAKSGGRKRAASDLAVAGV